MSFIVLVDKNKEKKETKNKDIDDLYKKCSFRKNNDFNKRHTWKVKFPDKEYNISVYAKDNGRGTNINKYELPPPIDKNLYYGTIALVNEDGDLTIELWEKIYEKLFGGFENLDDTKSEDEKEIDILENIPDKFKTKTGYLKDDFVVDDDDDNSSYNESELEEEAYVFTDDED